MNLTNAAKYFDRERFVDYFDDSVSFHGQVTPFTDSTRSGPSTPRRILSLASDISIPTRRVIKMVASERVYLVGNYNEDYWMDRVIRIKYPMIPVDVQASIGTMAQFLANSGFSTDIFVFLSYIKRVPLEEESSLYFPGYELYMSSYETLPTDCVIKYNSDYFRVRLATDIDGAGFKMGEVVKTESPLVSVTYTKKANPYNPVTDEYTPTVTSGVQAFIEPTRFNFLFTYPAFEKVEPGDKSISILKSAVPVARVGDAVDARTVVGVRDLSTYWVLHCR